VPRTFAGQVDGGAYAYAPSTQRAPARGSTTDHEHTLTSGLAQAQRIAVVTTSVYCDSVAGTVMKLIAK
jgi:hypothetical protein